MIFIYLNKCLVWIKILHVQYNVWTNNEHEASFNRNCSSHFSLRQIIVSFAHRHYTVTLFSFYRKYYFLFLFFLLLMLLLFVLFAIRCNVYSRAFQSRFRLLVFWFSMTFTLSNEWAGIFVGSYSICSIMRNPFFSNLLSETNFNKRISQIFVINTEISSNKHLFNKQKW